MLGYAQAVNDGCLLCRGIHPCRLDQLVRIDVANLSHSRWRILLHQRLQLIEVLGEVLDIIVIDQVLPDHHVHHSVCKCHVGSRTQLQMDICHI